MIYDTNEFDDEEWKSNDEDEDDRVFILTDKGRRYFEAKEKTVEELIEEVQKRRTENAYDYNIAIEHGLCIECGQGWLDQCVAALEKKHHICEDCSIINNIIEELEDEFEKNKIVETLDWKAHYIP